VSDLAVKSADTEPTELYIAFKVAGVEYALPATVVRQLESFTGATTVPGAPDFVAGIIQIRGRVVPVVDLRARFGLPAAPADETADRRVVVGEHGDRAVALLVDVAREVLKIAPSQLRAPPRILEEGRAGFVRALAHLGPRVVMVLDFQRVLGEELVDVG
jgi:purine-binding chemotaxis protein CheW